MSISGIVKKTLRPYQGAIYRIGLAMPEPEYETATGRMLYTISQVEKIVAQAIEAEREACAKACESEADDAKYNGVEAACLRIAEEIRARSNAEITGG